MFAGTDTRTQLQINHQLKHIFLSKLTVESKFEDGFNSSELWGNIRGRNQQANQSSFVRWVCLLVNGKFPFISVRSDWD